MNEPDAIKIVGLFLSAYPNANADEGTVDIWVDALTAIDTTNGRRAAAEWIHSNKFFPSIAEYLALVSGYRRRADLERSGWHALPGPRVPPVAEGMQIAKAAYLAECRAQNRDPRPRTLTGFDRGQIAGITTEPLERTA